MDKIKKNQFYILVFGIIMLAGIALTFTRKSDGPAISPTPELVNPTPEPSASPSVTATSKPIVKTPNPTPGIVFKEVPMGYDQLTRIMYEEGTWLKLDADCTSIAPSGVGYYNETQIMLDNTASKEKRILKIGSREYLLEAGEWFLVALSSPTLPANLPIYCGSMELGAIDLYARPN